jgi:hypothetical protein
MNSHQLFAGRAYVFNETNDIEEDSAEYLLIHQIVKKFKIPFLIEYAKNLDGNEDFDTYELKSQGKIYILKVSFDNKNPELINETFIFKNNDSLVLPSYVDSGEIVVGQPIRFLLTRKSNNLALEELGFSYPMTNIENYLSCFNTLCYSKCETKFEQYYSRLLDKINPEKWSEFVKKSVFSFYESKKIIPIYEALKLELESNIDHDFLHKNNLVNPRTTFENITTDGSFFQFSDCGDCFLSSDILGLCFFGLNFGLNKKARKKIIKKYCEGKNIKFKSIKEEYKSCMKVACCIFLFNSFYRFVIEETIFESSRPKNIVNMNLIMSNCLDSCSCLSCYEEIRLPIKNIFIRPIIEDREDRENFV